MVPNHAKCLVFLQDDLMYRLSLRSKYLMKRNQSKERKKNAPQRIWKKVLESFGEFVELIAMYKKNYQSFSVAEHL